jgi:hypothetical protein
MPAIASRDLAGPMTLPSDAESALEETFTLFVWACVDALIDTAPAARPKAFTEWSAEQRALFEEMAKLPVHVLVNVGELSDRIERAGATSMVLGDTRYLLRYVGLVPPGPLERVVDERPLWLWLRLHLMGTVSRHAWIAAATDLGDAERIVLADLALENAYQLLRCWPLPDTITPAQEAKDGTSLFEGLLPILSSVGDAAVVEAIRAELREQHPHEALIVLLAVMLAERGGAIPSESDEVLASALPLHLAHGRRLLARLPEERRSSIVSRMEPVPHHARGFWQYADLLPPAQRDAQITEALAAFRRPCRDDVAACVKALVRAMSPASRAELRKRTEGGPNAALIAEAT